MQGILAQLGARHRYSRMVHDELRVVLTFHDVRVGVRVRPRKTAGAPAVVLVAELGPIAAIDPKAALASNASLTGGMLATMGDILVLRAVLPVDGLSPEGLDRWLNALAAEAAGIKRRIVRPAGHGEVFEIYRD